jgi:hypothetical protein
VAAAPVADGVRRLDGPVILAAWTRPLHEALVPWDRPCPPVTFHEPAPAAGRAGVEAAVDEIVAVFSSVPWAVGGATVADGEVRVVARARWRWSVGLSLATFPAASPPDPAELRAKVAWLARTTAPHDLHAAWTALAAAPEALVCDDPRSVDEPLRSPRLVVTAVARRRVLQAVLGGVEEIALAGTVPRSRRPPSPDLPFEGWFSGVALSGRFVRGGGSRLVLEARVTGTVWGGRGPSGLGGRRWGPDGA